jgi:demethylmenaquinone methyltransferase/2-methoxy-6-polyprenyl-1,4-benzoquinol methylase
VAIHPPLSTLDPSSDLRDPARRRRYVSAVFETVAPSYDRFTRWFSFGMDARWKRQLARWAVDALRPGDVVVDLACGSGDVGRAVGRLSGWAVGVVGVDVSRPMLGLATRLGVGTGTNRPTAQPPNRLIRADMLALPLRDGVAGAATVGYGFRNTADVRRALAEAARVLRPGGWLFDLDFFRPESPAWRRVFHRYLWTAGRAAGRWWHRDPEAYGYIARSLEHWCTAAEFAGMLREAGFVVERVDRRLGGGIALHAGRAVGRLGGWAVGG